MLRNGTYKVTRFIHVFDCDFGQLKIAEGTWIDVDGLDAVAVNIKFPSRLLESVKDSLEKIR